MIRELNDIQEWLRVCIPIDIGCDVRTHRRENNVYFKN